MQPWFIATETFTSRVGEAWIKYVSWSGLGQLVEVVSLDSILCPTVLPDIKNTYWPYIVNEDCMLHFFTDLDFLLKEIEEIRERNLLCVYRNPPRSPLPFRGAVDFEFLGYDLVDKEGGVSVLTNCGGFPEVFGNSELSSKGLLSSHARALQVQSELPRKHPGEPHAYCHVWAIFRAVAP